MVATAHSQALLITKSVSLQITERVSLKAPLLPVLLPSTEPQDGDTVVIGDLEFEYDSDKSEAGACPFHAVSMALFAWADPSMLRRGVVPLACGAGLESAAAAQANACIFPAPPCPAGMYDKWYKERRAAGVVGKGQARWPHVTG